MNDDLFLVEKNIYRNHVFCFNAEYENWIGLGKIETENYDVFSLQMYIYIYVY